MVLRIAGLPVWVGPSELMAGARATMGWTDDAVELVGGLPQRVASLLDEVEGLVGRVSRIAERADVLVDRAEAVVGSIDGVLVDVRATVAGVDGVLSDTGTLVSRAATVAEGAAGVVGRAGQVAEGASEVVSGAEATSNTASRLIGLYQPLAEKAAPLAQRFVEDFSQAELDAAIRMIDQLPQLTHHVETDVMPILVTLDRVGPDVHELLDVLKEVRLAVQGIPGFKMLRRRGENKEAGADAEADANGG